MENTNNRPARDRRRKIAVIVAAAVAVALIATLASLVGVFAYRNGAWNMQVDNLYRQSYYTLSDNLLTMENNLSKIRVTRGEELQQELLMNIALAAQSATSSLTALSHGGYDMTPLIKYCNQVGDYSSYGARKIAFGLGLNDDDYKTFSDMHAMTYRIANELNAVRDKITDNGEKFVMGLGQMGQSLSAAFESLSGADVEYPSLIYDGPFSDALDSREALALKNMESIDPKQADNYVARALGGRILKSLTYVTTNESAFETYLYEFTTEDGTSGSIQISKQGGMPVMWDTDASVDDPRMTQEEAVELARQYCDKIGLPSMAPVWACVSDSIVYVNLCYKRDETIYYPDMVKVKVSLQDGAIVGYEGLNYLYNHTDRTFGTPTVGEEQVRAGDYGRMQISSVRLCVTPMPGGSEKLAWEVYGSVDVYRFFLFVDASTGKQFRIMQVIDSDEGELLM